MNIAVIGTGTAGVMSLSHLLAWLPETCKITSIYNPKIPMLGIGESTSTSIPKTLYYGTGFNLLTEPEKLDATVKHGVKYSNWREQTVYTTLPPPNYAMHFNNFKLREVSFDAFTKLWGNKFEELTGEITLFEDKGDYVQIDVDNVQYTFDYVIDCRGFPKSYEKYDMVDTIPVNHCIVHGVNEPGDWNYTHHYAHPNGWMFGIPLQTRQGWGYLYNDNITTKDQAIENLKSIKNGVDADKLREFTFKSYKAKKFIDGRIINNGNRALFYEPIEALSGWFYDQVLRSFFDVIITQTLTEEVANNSLSLLAEDYELFICFMYHGGSTYDSDFWKITAEKCSKRLNESARFAEHVKKLSSLPSELIHNDIVRPIPSNVWLHLDKEFGYNYFRRENESRI